VCETHAAPATSLTGRSMEQSLSSGSQKLT